MKKNLVFKRRNTFLAVLLSGVALSTSVYGYWVDQIRADCAISFKHNAVIMVTGLPSPDNDNDTAQTKEASDLNDSMDDAGAISDMGDYADDSKEISDLGDFTDLSGDVSDSDNVTDGPDDASDRSGDAATED